MILRLSLPCLLLCLSAGAQTRLNITVTNPSDAPRINEPAVLAWTDLASRLPALSDRAVLLTDEQGRLVLTQADDLDFDGIPDELVFAVDLPVHGSKRFILAAGEARPAPYRVAGPRTDAGNWKRRDGALQPVDDDSLAGADRDRRAYRFDGVGWESDIAAYRLYLDGRNAVDIQGKRRPGLYWNWIGASGVDYQLDADWGMDVLHVGPALGVGGIGFWSGDSVLKPLDVTRQRCRIVARGPVRAVVRVEYGGWRVGGGTANVTSIFTILAGDRVTEHRVTLEGGGAPQTLATGIVIHDSTEVLWNPGGAWLCTHGLQSRAGDSLMLALTAPPQSVLRQADDSVNRLLLLALEPDRPLRFLISSYWQGETGRMWTAGEMRAFLDATARRLDVPLVLKVAGLE